MAKNLLQRLQDVRSGAIQQRRTLKIEYCGEIALLWSGVSAEQLAEQQLANGVQISGLTNISVQRGKFLLRGSPGLTVMRLGSAG